MKMFKSFSLIAVLITAVIVLFSMQTGIAEPVSDATNSSQGLISVSGSADVMVIPDEVVITLGIDTRDKDIVKAKTQNDEKVQKIVSLAKKFKIESKNIKIDYVDIKPGDITVKSVYEPYYEQIPSKNMGYIVRKSIVITLKDLTTFEDFLTEVVKNGAEYVQGVQFKTSELRTHKDKARELAVKAAKEKADAMSGVLGQKTGKAVLIKEEQEYYWSWYDSWYGGFYRGSSVNSFANSVQNVVSSGEYQETGGLEPGQIKVSAKVSIDFVLE